MLHYLDLALGIALFAWNLVLIAMQLSNGRLPGARTLWFEMKPLVPVMIIVSLVVHVIADGPDWKTLILRAFYALLWFHYRNHWGDDDRWGRRVERALGVVKDLGHRLTVEPVPAGSGA